MLYFTLFSTSTIVWFCLLVWKHKANAKNVNGEYNLKWFWSMKINK